MGSFKVLLWTEIGQDIFCIQGWSKPFLGPQVWARWPEEAPLTPNVQTSTVAVFDNKINLIKFFLI